jgi:hypothetical protein
VPASRPDPIDIFEHYLRALEAFSTLRTQLLATPGAGVVPAPPDSRFAFLTPAEVEVALRRMSIELSYQTVFLLLASSEASLRVDFDERVARRGKDAISQGCRRLAQTSKASGQRGIRLEDILDIYRNESPITTAKSAVGRLKTLLHFRHWVAHGRYWVDKSGMRDPDPFDVWNDLRHLFASLPGFAPLPVR